MIKEINSCEVCGSSELLSVLDLGQHPMCDDIVRIGDARICTEYPIEILYCNNCKTAHQRFQVPKEELFPNSYHYRSRFTGDVLAGMSSLVDSCVASFGTLAGKSVLDIGCNDGSLLGFFREQGARTIGLEPTDSANDARQAGHIVFKGYLTGECADHIVHTYGSPDFITFTNVFAHIEDLKGLLGSLKKLIGSNTILVIENHYLGAVFDRNQFDTFYHEHPRTYSFMSFIFMARTLGMNIFDVEFPSRYGGNIRVFICHHEMESLIESDRFHTISQQEADFEGLFSKLRSNVVCWKQHKGQQIENLVHQYGPLSAKAFPGRAAILVKLLGLDVSSIAAVYERPGSLKIGHYLPGTRIPIRSDDELLAMSDRSKPILNLAWHISVEIEQYLRSKDFRGEIIDILAPKDFLSP